MSEAVEVPFTETFLKCSGCNCLFLNKIDLKRHVNKFGREPHDEYLKRFHRKIDAGDEEETGQVVWHKAKFGNGEITLSDNDHSLARLIEQQHEVRMGMYLYTLSNDKKWMIRKIATE